ncbi:alanine dehydrogenase [Arthrobacter silviterrae]|uniref:Alanine dehydrogenase n=1 Tax=Arthrobacter silviterrae TaxID=2026658 RepID=A0ABX0DCR4_9MICC|nr:N(5)-(carboxyethyl)ornithine synthase [Arthrobacter silviterrae]MDQ0278042.1 alanine dehydrogenase [Arthrobacter silviterrae]NGN83595.1 alanine dehydrogenase [Arthrobacter silviterrae]
MTAASSGLRLGVIGTSRKPDERRAPIHPEHFSRIEADIRARMVVEEGYGEQFGMSDAALAELVGGVSRREEVVAGADVVLLPKPQASDLAELRDGQVLWGWPHCVQDREITQLAIDKKLTLIAFEAMNHWASDGGFGLHVFHKNNELAGYSSIMHSLSLIGSTGDYGRRMKAVVIGFGATARGAVTALNALGIREVQVLTSRSVAAVAAPIHSAEMVQFDFAPEPPHTGFVMLDDGDAPLAAFLAEADIVVNCTLQDPNAPMTYLTEADLAGFRPGSLIVDVSCDEGMGFSWARNTSFTDPMFTVGDNVNYYAVDHTPSYLWNSASWEISEALLPFIEPVLAGPAAWADNDTIRRAIEIRDGIIVNPAILEFQRRQADYPHLPMA